jgi:hypothetical protein
MYLFVATFYDHLVISFLGVYLLAEVARLDRQEMGSKVFIQDPAWARPDVLVALFPLERGGGNLLSRQLSSTWRGYVLFAFLGLVADSERGRAISAL